MQVVVLPAFERRASVRWAGTTEVTAAFSVKVSTTGKPPAKVGLLCAASGLAGGVAQPARASNAAGIRVIPASLILFVFIVLVS